MSWMLGMTTDRIEKIAYIMAIHIALLGAFFLGFSACGADARVSFVVVMIVLVSICFAVIKRWLLFRCSPPAQSSRLQPSLSIVSFFAVLITGCVVANALGWVMYYSTTSVGEAYREFKTALIGNRCG